MTSTAAEGFSTRPVGLLYVLAMFVIVASTWSSGCAALPRNEDFVYETTDLSDSSTEYNYIEPKTSSYVFDAETSNIGFDPETSANTFDPETISDDLNPETSANDFDTEADANGFENEAVAASDYTVQAALSRGQQFVQARGEHFWLNGRKHFVNGVNLYYLMTLGSYADGRRLVTDILRASASVGVTVVRAWAFADGDANYNLQLRPGVYNEAVFRGLDYAIAESKKVGIRLILCFVNNYADYGGRKQYAAWAQRYAGKGNAKEDDFYTDGTIRQWYRNHIKKVLTRVNTITRVAYRDDPAIFSWELINEPRCESDKSGNALHSWIQEMARYVKSLDRNHMLEVGLEGFYSSIVSPNSVYSQSANPGYPGTYAAQFGTDFVRHNQIAEIDFTTVHSYPDSWIPNHGEYQKRSFMASWIKTHITDSKYRLRKPILFAEFGKSDKSPGYSEQARINDMNDMFNAVYASARSGGPAAGALIWQFVPRSLKYNLQDGYCIVLSESYAIAALMRKQSARMAALR